MAREDSELREIVFDEAGLEDLESIGKQLWARGNSPEDPGYQRVLMRPRLNWWRIAFRCLAPLEVATLLFFLLQSRCPLLCQVLLPVGFIAVWTVFHVKQCAICLVHMYQYFAPEAIRNKCRFEPSCSEYMIRAIEKYGFVKGVRKGADRLRRCNIHHGGYDEP